MILYLKNINYIISDKKNLFLIIVVFVISSFLDSLGIGFLASFFTSLINSDLKIPLIEYLNVTSILEIVIILIIIFFLRTVFIVFSIFVTQKFSLKTQHSLRIELSSIYLNQNYEQYLSRDTSEYNENIQNLILIFTSNTLVTGLKIISDLILLFFLIILMSITNIKLVLFLITLMFLFGIGYDIFFKKKLYQISKISSESSKKIFKSTNEIFKGFKEIRVYFKEFFFIQKLIKASSVYYKNYLKFSVISNLPRYLLEFLLILSFLLFILFSEYQNINFKELITSLGVFALASLRIIPSVNSLIRSMTEFRFGEYATSVIASDLRNNISEKRELGEYHINKDFIFNNIKFVDVGYKYQNKDRNFFLEKINFKINKGEFVGIIGPSGAGKTTIINMLIGLIEPLYGKILINEQGMEANKRNWQAQVAYLPQDIFLICGTILENITMQEDESINQERLKIALEKSNLKFFIKDLKDGVNTVIGEDGIKISGGQKQRIGIARALYSGKKIIILDESTNSLDEKTKSNILQEVYMLKGIYTIILIDHNQSFYSQCDQVLTISQNSLK